MMFPQRPYCSVTFQYLTYLRKSSVVFYKLGWSLKLMCFCFHSSQNVKEKRIYVNKSLFVFRFSFLDSKGLFISTQHLVALFNVLQHVWRGSEMPLAPLETLCHQLNKLLRCQERINTLMRSCWLKTTVLFDKGLLGTLYKAFPMVWSSRDLICLSAWETELIHL